MSKPWEETWHMTAMGGIGDAAGPPYGWIAGFVQAGESALRPTDADKARARLAAAAPDLVRALLEVEWTGATGTPPEAKGCISCGGVHPDYATAACVERQYGFLRQQVPVGHRGGCVVAEALRKAGVIP